MTVEDLINQLHQFDPKAMVVIKGHEGGFDEVAKVRCISIKLNQNTEWYYGAHESCSEKEADCVAIQLC